VQPRTQYTNTENRHTDKRKKTYENIKTLGNMRNTYTLVKIYKESLKILKQVKNDI